MRKYSAFLMGALCALALTAPATAGTVVSGFNSTILPANDDQAVGPVNLGFSANFFGVTRTQTYVSNNGYVTFDSAQYAFTPTGLGAGYVGLPIIAAYFADVDTRGAGSSPVTYGTGTFDGRDAFGVNYIDVGYFSSRSDVTNSFQILLVDRSDVADGDFDIVFNYDRILWQIGSASDVTAAAGFNAGTGEPGSYYELPGSRVTGALIDGGPNSLVANSNVGVAGRYVFSVRNGEVSVPAVPEPTTWALMIGGFALAGASMRRRSTKIGFA